MTTHFGCVVIRRTLLFTLVFMTKRFYRNINEARKEKWDMQSRHFTGPFWSRCEFPTCPARTASEAHERRSLRNVNVFSLSEKPGRLPLEVFQAQPTRWRKYISHLPSEYFAVLLGRGTAGTLCFLPDQAPDK